MALNGTVPSYPQYLEAAAAAQRVDGVKNVHNHLEVVLPPGDYRDDAMLTTAANNALTLNITVPDGIEASARDGNLKLTGTVKFGARRAAAELAVAGLTGVRNIRDDIEIGYDADPVDVDVLVQDALGRWALIPDDSDVTVDTKGNTVTLTGHVRTWVKHDAVVDAAWMASGVYHVNDVLTVTRLLGHRQRRWRMAGNRSGQAPRVVPAGRAPPPAGGDLPRAGDAPVQRKDRRHPGVRWIVHGVPFVALAAGVFGLLPRIGGLAHDAAGLRHARAAFVVAAVFAQALSLGCYALLYRRVLTSLGARVPFALAARVTLASFLVSRLTAPPGWRGTSAPASTRRRQPSPAGSS